MKLNFAKFFIILILPLMFISAASAYTAQFADGAKTVRLHWKSPVIPIAVSSAFIKQTPGIKAETDALDVVRRSFDSWEKAANVRFELKIVDLYSVSPVGRTGDGVNLVTIAQTPENLLLFSGSVEEISARTRTFHTAAGRISEADIVLNPYQQFSSDGSIGTFDLEATLTHEIGHLLGLEHSLIPGATMFEQQGKNGIYGLAGFAARTLAHDDLSGIRALYGAKNSSSNSVGCCGTVAGKLIVAGGGSTGKDIQVWLEEAETGRVAAGVLTNTDGSFRIEGLTAGKYSVYAQDYGSRKFSAATHSLGEIDVNENKIVNLTRKIEIAAKTFEVSHIGFNGQISVLAVPVNSGKSFLIYVGGKNLDADKLKIGFNSSNFTVAPESLIKQDYGTEISVISFEVRINAGTQPGEYSFFVRAKNDETTYVVGGLTLDNFTNPWNSLVIPPAG